MGATSDTTRSKAHSVFIRLVLPPYTIHFKSPSYIKDATLDFLDKTVCKETLRTTASSALARNAIGLDEKFWAELCVLLKAAIPSLERRSFTIWDPAGVDYESTSGILIASHHPGLWRDLERLNDLVSISRNILTAGAEVQQRAAEHGLEAEIFRLVNCCVRVTARGYDGDAGTGEEEKWQWIVNAYKKLLITSLQVLNNAVAKNERRKLMLWVSLFDSPAAGEGAGALAPEDVPETSSASLTDVPSNPTYKPHHPLEEEDLVVAYGVDAKGSALELEGAQPLWDDVPFEHYPLPKEVLEMQAKLKKGKEKVEGDGYALFVKRLRGTQVEDYNVKRGRDPTLAEAHLEFPRRWAELSDEDHEYWQCLFDDVMAKYRQDLAVYEAKMIAVTETQPVLRSDVPVAEQTRQVERKIAMLEEQLAEKYKANAEELTSEDAPVFGQEGHLTFDSDSLASRPVVADDMRMLFTAEAGMKILESGKAELMKRLEGYEAPLASDPASPPMERSGELSRESSNEENRGRARGLAPVMQHEDTRPLNTRPAVARTVEEPDDESAGEDEEDDEHDPDREHESQEEGEEEEDDEDYPGSTEDGRGLLTDVPLILGPSEIEVLPMLIMSGIVPPIDISPNLSVAEKNALLNMHTVRTHLLLSQSNGRNLLRELLIFVAAWDLREEELYFKFMVKIMEAILRNGLMPYAYHAFRDRSRSKDIISPAQAVIMKLLTCIFRARGEAAKAAVAAGSQARSGHPTQTLAHAIVPSSTASNWKPALLPNMPSRVDLHILNFIFTEFRQHIVPQTCALIFLQGQIHAGRASPEDFPLNLWDMERMYEGVYQYLEFFAVLTEEGVWKGILGEWEMASELVTLLRELEGGIPKMGAVVPRLPRRVSNHPPQRAMSADAATMHHMPRAVSQPAHYSHAHPIPPSASAPAQSPTQSGTPAPDAEHPDPILPPLPLHPPTNGTAPVFESETPSVYSANHDSTLPPITPQPVADLHHDQDEPSDFEWRNLKKLTVLVLSSLIWKNRTVQDQVRRAGGLEALVGCCRNDEHNPYIREHAIMCLRFAVEGCEENGKVIRRMASLQQQQQQQQQPQGGQQQARRLEIEGGNVTHAGTAAAPEDIPREVLDTNGYETFMDQKGQVGLRRKEPPAAAPLSYSAASPAYHASSSNPTTTSSSSAGVSKPAPRLSGTKLTAERAAELMNSALSSLPLGDKFVTDRQKVEALAKLDRAFESTEKILGNERGRGNG